VFSFVCKKNFLVGLQLPASEGPSCDWHGNEDSEEEDAFDADASLKARCMTSIWSFENGVRYNGFHMLRKIDAEMDQIWLLDPILVPEHWRVTQVELQIGLWSGHVTCMWRDLHRLSSESEVMLDKEELCKSSVLDALPLFTKHGLADSTKYKIASGGPGVAKTSGIICEQVRKCLESNKRALVVASTRTARSQISACLVPMCQKANYVVEVCGSGGLSVVEAVHTREARLATACKDVARAHDEAAARMEAVCSSINTFPASLKEQESVRVGHLNLFGLRQKMEAVYNEMKRVKKQMLQYRYPL